MTDSMVEHTGDAFRALRRGITRSRAFSLHLCICDAPASRDALIADLAASMPTVVVRRVELGAHDEDVLDSVEKAIDEARPGPLVVVIVGTERALSDTDQAWRFLGSLNLRRALWPERVPYPVVFWIPRCAQGLLTSGAPDFFDWRSDTIEFPEIIEEGIDAVDGLVPAPVRELRARFGVNVMLQHRIEQWNAEILERGRRLGYEEGREEGYRKWYLEAYQEAYQQGYQQGYQEGRLEEVIIFIRLLYQRRFGAPSSELAQQIAAMPLEKGEALVMAFLDFSSVADFEDWLRGSGFFADQNGPIEMASGG